MRKLVIGSGATLIAIGGVLAANAEPVTGAGAVQVTEKTAAAPISGHKMPTDVKMKIDDWQGESARKNKLSSEGKWKTDAIGENKLADGHIKLSPSSESGILKAAPQVTVPQSDTYMK
jgi:osmotically-inducible protein OsmY